MESNQTSYGSGFHSASGLPNGGTAKGHAKITVRLVSCYRRVAGIFADIKPGLAVHVTIKFAMYLFLAIGVSASLAFIVTAKWYMVLTAALFLCGGWFVLYKFEEGRTAKT